MIGAIPDCNFLQHFNLGCGAPDFDPALPSMRDPVFEPGLTPRTALPGAVYHKLACARP